jgi:hypothetical protein
LSHVNTLANKVKELVNKVTDIQREQRYMREVEATFRDASEMTNTRAVWWSLVQIGVLVGAAIWQMRYLKVSPIRPILRRRVRLMIRSTLKTRSLDNEMMTACNEHITLPQIRLRLPVIILISYRTLDVNKAGLACSIQCIVV